MKKHFKSGYTQGLMTWRPQGLLIVRMRSDKWVEQTWLPGVESGNLEEFLMFGESFYDPEHEQKLREEYRARMEEREALDNLGQYGVIG